jgi:hypothetical protein
MLPLGRPLTLFRTRPAQRVNRWGRLVPHRRSGHRNPVLAKCANSVLAIRPRAGQVSAGSVGLVGGCQALERADAEGHVGVDGRSSSSSRTSRGTCTSCGTGCRRAAVSGRRCGWPDPQARWQGGPAFRCARGRGPDRATVAAMPLEPEAEKIFHRDSYGYRPGKSTLDAVAACRRALLARRLGR